MDSLNTALHHLICPICSGKSHSIIGQVPANWLRAAYLRSFRIAIEATQTLILNRCDACGLEFFTGVPSGNSDFYSALQTFPWYYRADKWEYRHVAKSIPLKSRVLDVGCGVGEFSANLPPGTDFTGIDFNATAIEEGRSKGRNLICETVQSHLGSNASSYDFVCSFQVMEHVSDPLPVLKAMVDLLRPSGTLVISVPNNDAYIGWQPNAFLNMPPHHMLRWNRRSLSSLAAILGLSDPHFTYEPLDPAHQRDYLMFLIRALLIPTILTKQVIYRSDIPFKVATRIASSLASRAAGLDLPPSILPIGHAVIASYSKPPLAIMSD